MTFLDLCGSNGFRAQPLHLQIELRGVVVVNGRIRVSGKILEYPSRDMCAQYLLHGDLATAVDGDVLSKAVGPETPTHHLRAEPGDAARVPVFVRD